MLTRLKVSGFKNLVDVDVHFSPFTCVAGRNGVGKSNLFDAIQFLSALADRPLLEAASTVRDSGKRASDIRSLFHRIGNRYARTMSFEVEMIVSPEAIDDLGQQAEASTTFLRYTLELSYRVAPDLLIGGRLEIKREELTHINISDASKVLKFPHTPQWRSSVVQGRRTSDFISTEPSEGSGKTRIKLHQDGTGGRPRSFDAADLPRTVLSAATAAESPTALVARREMQSWQLLQLEPAQLRKEDEFTDLMPTRLSTTGSHLPATLYALARNAQAGQVYAQVANRLAELLDDVESLTVERDERRELLTLYLTGRDQTTHPARALSDGTLRFLALAVIEMSALTGGVICLEEPENGIHPARIPAMLRLLQDIAVDPTLPVGDDNPLRQVIINTHEPAVVQLIPEASLLLADLTEQMVSASAYTSADAGDHDPPQLRSRGLVFRYLRDTWRSKLSNAHPDHVIPLGDLLRYLRPTFADYEGSSTAPATPQPRRVIDHPDIQQLLPSFAVAGDAAE